MRRFALWGLFAVVGIAFTSLSCGGPVRVGVGVGVAPDCPYGYFAASPYNCAPAGYYGPEWFHGGVFIGAGPWFRGPRNFRGYVNNGFHPEHGYRGPMPARGEKAEEAKRVDAAHFRGNELRDGRGHVVKEKKK